MYRILFIVLGLCASGQAWAQEAYYTCTQSPANASGSLTIPSIGKGVAHSYSDRLIGNWVEVEVAQWACTKNGTPSISLQVLPQIKSLQPYEGTFTYPQWSMEFARAPGSTNYATSFATYRITGTNFGYIASWHINASPMTGNTTSEWYALMETSSGYQNYRNISIQNSSSVVTVRMQARIRLVWLGTGDPPASIEPFSFDAVQFRLQTQARNNQQDPGIFQNAPGLPVASVNATINSTAGTCTTPANTLVDFGDVKVTDFNGVNTFGAEKDFSLTLTDCPQMTRIHWFMYTNTPHATFANTIASSPATGVSVQIFDTSFPDPLIIPFNSKRTLFTSSFFFAYVPPTSTLFLKARLIQTEAPITPGPIQATAIIQFVYQ